MPVAPEVLAALEAALAADPSADGVRLHLAGLLLEAGRSEDALEHAARVLARQPDSVEALRVAAGAATACGLQDRAAGYRRLLRALGGAEAEPPEQARAGGAGGHRARRDDRAGRGDRRRPGVGNNRRIGRVG